MRLSPIEVNPFFEYGDTGIFVQIRYVPDSQASSAIDQSTQVIFDKKHQKSEKVDGLKFNSKMLKLALVGWKPFARKLLRFLISPDQKLNLDTGETWDDLIEPTPENIDLVLRNTHVDFKNFVVMAARDAETFIRAEEAQEIENLRSTSAGS